MARGGQRPAPSAATIVIHPRAPADPATRAALAAAAVAARARIKGEGRG